MKLSRIFDICSKIHSIGENYGSFLLSPGSGYFYKIYTPNLLIFTGFSMINCAEYIQPLKIYKRYPFYKFKEKELLFYKENSYHLPDDMKSFESSIIHIIDKYNWLEEVENLIVSIEDLKRAEKILLYRKEVELE